MKVIWHETVGNDFDKWLSDTTVNYFRNCSALIFQICWFSLVCQVEERYKTLVVRGQQKYLSFLNATIIYMIKLIWRDRN